MLGADDSSLYVVFMGTKHMRDVVVDANLLQEAVWQDEKQQVTSTSLRPHQLSLIFQSTQCILRLARVSQGFGCCICVCKLLQRQR